MSDLKKDLMKLTQIQTVIHKGQQFTIGTRPGISAGNSRYNVYDAKGWQLFGMQSFCSYNEAIEAISI